MATMKGKQKAVKVIIKQISNIAWIFVRIKELKGKKIVAKDVKSKAKLEKIINSPIAYCALKAISTSSDYYENMRK